MPIIQILIAGSAIVALVIGVQAFGPGIKISGKSQTPWRGPGAKIVGVACLVYGCGALLAIAAIALYVALGR